MKISIRKKVKRQFVTGLAVLLPIGLTIYILWLLFGLVSKVLSPLVLRIPLLKEFPLIVVRLISFLITMFIIWWIGLTASNIIGRNILRFSENLILRVPVINRIYQTIRQLVETVFSSEISMRQVVLVEYPRKGVYSLAFVTNAFEVGGKKRLCLLIPTTPNPTSGFFVITGEEEVIPLKIPVEEGIKLVMSAGIIQPKDFQIPEE